MKHATKLRLDLHALAAAAFAACGCTAAQAQERTLGQVEVRDTAPVAGAIRLDAPADTGSRLGLTIRETPAAVYVVDRVTMEERGDRTTQEALRNVPGISFTNKPDVGGFVTYRGFNGSQLTQLFNGITVQYDVVAARPVDGWIYDRVEVIGGPSSFLYGAGAVGGSINYVTRLPERGNSADALLRAGTYGTGQAAVGMNRQLSGEPSGLGNYLRIDANTQTSASRTDGNREHSGQLAASLLSDLTGQLTHTLALEYQHERLQRPYWGTPLLRPTTGSGRILPGTEYENYNSADGRYAQTVKWFRSILDYRASDTLRLKNTLYHYEADRRYQDVEEYRFNPANTAVVRFSPLLQRHDQDLTGDRVEATYNAAIAGHKSDFAFGLDVSENRQTRFPTGPVVDVSTVNPYNYSVENFFSIPGINPPLGADREVRVRTLAFFAENRTQLAPAWSLVTGLRHDRIDLDLFNRRAVTAASPATLGQSYSPTTGRIGLVWDVTPAANVYVQYATAADPPAGILTTASFAQARTNTSLTTGKQVELGSKMRFWDGKAVATLAAYHIVRKNLTTPDPAMPTSTVLVGEQSSRGIEAALDTRLTSQLTAQANIAFVDPHYDNFSENVAGVAVSRAGRTPPNTPRRVANLWLDYAFAPGWDAVAGVRAVSMIYGNSSNTLSAPGYGLLDLGLNWRYAKNITLRARIRNVANKVYANNVTTTPMFYLGESRTADITARLSF